MEKKIRYAVVGLGWIAQETVLPAFKNAQENSELTALVSDDPVKLKEMGKKYNIPSQQWYSYKDYDRCLNSGLIDAVYIALPNALHKPYVMRAAEAGIHILCEKPMAMDEQECMDIIEAVNAGDVKFMVAYRLHFEEGNLKAIELAQSGKLGELRAFNSIFTMQVEKGNVRLDDQMTGGPLYDIGIYCINAVRGIFRQEPQALTTFICSGSDKRFDEVDEMVSVIMRFPDEKLATFTCSFGASPLSSYEIIGTKGILRVSPAFSHNALVKHTTIINEKQKEKEFKARDQFAPELIYFSDCILHNKEPEPSALEGLADVRIIQAIFESARQGRAIVLDNFHKSPRPGMKQAAPRFEVPRPQLVRAKSPSKK